MSGLPSWVHAISAAGLVAILWFLVPMIWALLQSPEVSHWIRVCGPLCNRCDRARRRKGEKARHRLLIRQMREKRGLEARR